jgi:hypothetical protein
MDAWSFVVRAATPLIWAAVFLVSVSAQKAAYSPPRTSWGDPDLQGVWPSGQLIDVPFERPVEMGTRATLNDAEFELRDQRLRRQAAEDASERPTGGGGAGGPIHWLERGRASRQASLVVDPPNGRLPALTAEGARRAELWRRRADGPAYAGPEDFTPYDRCITRGVLGGAFPNIYGAGFQILQTRGVVVLRYEMIHEERIIPMDGRPHLPAAITSYMGDARGRWEGTTLVVETTNFNGRTGSYGRNGNGNPTSEALRLTERLRLLDRDTLQYEVTVNDPQTFTGPWTVSFPISRDPGYVLYEYACHEGNYAIANMLRGARGTER